MKKNWQYKKNQKKYPTSYPSETLIRILLSSKKYLGIELNMFEKNFKVFELGSFYGNNLRFFLDNKIDVYGSEIDNKGVARCTKNLKKIGYKNLKISKAENIKTNKKNNSFDLLISINTLHYSIGKDIEKSLKEFSRVLKKNGIAIIETPNKNHQVFKNSKKIRKFEYVWNYNDFRKNQKFGFIENKLDFKKICLKYFKKVLSFSSNSNFKMMKLGSNFFICIK